MLLILLIITIDCELPQTDVCRRTVSSVKGRARLLEEEGQRRRRRRAGRFSPQEDERILRAVLHHNPASLQVIVRHCTDQTFLLRHSYSYYMSPFPLLA